MYSLRDKLFLSRNVIIFVMLAGTSSVSLFFSRIICPELRIKNKKESNVRLLLEIKFVYLCDKIFRRIICSETKDFGVIFIVRKINLSVV